MSDKPVQLPDKNSSTFMPISVSNGSGTGSASGSANGSGSPNGRSTDSSAFSPVKQQASPLKRTDSRSSVASTASSYAPVVYPTFEVDEGGMSDVTLIVEGRKLFAHKQLLSLVSPVFKEMFSREMCDTEENCVQLPDKKVQHVVEFLQCIYPPWKPVSQQNVRVLLKIADEYRVEAILHKCEDFLLTLRLTNCNIERCLMAYGHSDAFASVSDLLGLASSASLLRLQDHLIEQLSRRPLLWATEPDFFARSSLETENAILRTSLKEVLQLVEKNTYCSSVKTQLS